ncbi:MAG: hypothetical protein PQJ35_06075 [Sphaerochaetaceae bacterium]|nr:hypothetical protein [Sphaerochaetaceae bacterium]
MARQHSQIEEVERQVAEVGRVLQHLYAQLGELALSCGSPVMTKEAKSLYEDFSRCAAQSEKVKSRLAKFQDIKASFKRNSNRLKELSSEKKERNEFLKLLYSRIGVIVWEEAESGVLSDRILLKIPEIQAMQEESSVLSSARDDADRRYQSAHFLLKIPMKVNVRMKNRRLKFHTGKYGEFFIRIGRTVATQNLISSLNSTKRSLFNKEHTELLKIINEIDEEAAMISEQIRYSHHRLEQEGINGSLARKISDIESELRESDKARNHAAILYGKYISAMIDPSELEEHFPGMTGCYHQIIEQQELKTELLGSIKRLSIEKKIEELVLLLQQDEDHIAHIELSIGQLNRQIEEIRKTMASKKEQIGLLQQQLGKVLLIGDNDGKP